MSMVLRNARGRNVQVRDVTRDDLQGLAERIAAEKTRQQELEPIPSP